MCFFLMYLSSLCLYFRAYLNNIKLVDKGIKDMVALIENFYNHDKQTSYVMTSDHGMTDWGLYFKFFNFLKAQATYHICVVYNLLSCFQSFCSVLNLHEVFFFFLKVCFLM